MYSAEYDIPFFVKYGWHSKAFATFLHHWFEDSRGLTRGEVNLNFLKKLTRKERERAQSLLRRNLPLKYTHIVDGLAALEDISAVPELRKMLAEEPDLSRRLTLSGTLWKLIKDDVFFDCLNQMMASEDKYVRQAHIDQILWLEDERSIDLLINLLDDEDSFVRHLALVHLNHLEFGYFPPCPPDKLRAQATEYKERRNVNAFRVQMIEGLLKYNQLVYDTQFNSN